MFTCNGASVVPMAPPMRERGGAALYLPQDGHWNSRGHAAVAEILAPHVGRALADRKR